MNRGGDVENDAREIMPFNICTSYHMREIMLILEYQLVSVYHITWHSSRGLCLNHSLYFYVAVYRLSMHHRRS